MALTKSDLQAIGKIMDEKMDVRFGEQDRKMDKRFGDIDKRFGEQDRKMDKRFKVAFSDKVLGKIIRGQINNALEDVVFPRFDDLKKDIGGNKRAIKKNGVAIKELESKVSNLDRWLFRVNDHQARKLDNHEERIVSLEAQRVIMTG